MIVLSIDSATECASCALVSDEKLIGEINYNSKKQHSIILMPMVDKLLKDFKLTLEDIDGFVVSKGPGSFTGLRIGMSMVKGLSQGTNKPFVSISSLDALAFNFPCSNSIVCPILDALRDNVYTALYYFNDGNLNKLTDYMTLYIDDLIEMIKKYNSPVIFVGDAVPKFKDKLANNILNTYFAPNHLNVVKASSLGELGIKKLLNKEYDNLYTSVPIYLRKPQAEREYEKKMSIKNE